MEVTFFIKSIHKFGVILNTAINLGIAVSILVARVKHHFDAMAPGNVIQLVGVMLNRSQSALTSVCLRRCGDGLATMSGNGVLECSSSNCKGGIHKDTTCVFRVRVCMCVCVCAYACACMCVCVDVCVCGG